MLTGSSPGSLNLKQIQVLNKFAESVTISIDVKRYLYDVLIFLRRHRAVAGGITPLATKHFELLARYIPAFQRKSNSLT